MTDKPMTLEDCAWAIYNDTYARRPRLLADNTEKREQVHSLAKAVIDRERELVAFALWFSPTWMEGNSDDVEAAQSAVRAFLSGEEN